MYMFCPKCTSEGQRQFVAEINIHCHFSGLKNLDKPSVFVFPKILVCLDCGFSQFTLEDTELTLLAEGAGTSHTSIKKKIVDPGHFRSRECA
jgi:hypothetical protein